MPDVELEVSENYFQSILSHNSIRNKNLILAGDFNSNVEDFEQNKKVQNFVNLMFQFGLVPTINRVLLNLPTTGAEPGIFQGRGGF